MGIYKVPVRLVYKKVGVGIYIVHYMGLLYKKLGVGIYKVPMGLMYTKVGLGISKVSTYGIIVQKRGSGNL